MCDGEYAASLTRHVHDRFECRASVGILMHVFRSLLGLSIPFQIALVVESGYKSDHSGGRSVANPAFREPLKQRMKWLQNSFSTVGFPPNKLWIPPPPLRQPHPRFLRLEVESKSRYQLVSPAAVSHRSEWMDFHLLVLVHVHESLAVR